MPTQATLRLSVTATQPGNAQFTAAAPVTQTFAVRCFPDQLPFAVRGPFGTVVVAQLSFVTQDPGPGGAGCTGTFRISLPQLPPAQQAFAAGTYNASTAATVASASLSGTVSPPYVPVPFTGTIAVDVATQKVATSATFPGDPQDPPLTVPSLRGVR